MNFVPKMTHKYTCEKCDYHTANLKDYKKHLQTKKHKSVWGQNLFPKMEIMEIPLSCDVCSKQYTSYSGLWKHKKVCKCVQKNPKTDTDIVDIIIKQNTDSMKDMVKMQNENIEKITEKITGMVLEICKSNGIINTINSHNNTNSNNKTFNLQFFLNETCKDAMNITDFVESIKLQLSDLERIGEVGYVEGISSIITTNLKALDITQRPIHCTDKKRETMYIKDENKWEKDDDNKSKIRQAINKVANKNIRLLPQFKEKYPDYNNAYSKVSDVYDKMIIEVMTTANDKNDKIIHNISRCTTIDKII